MAEVFVRNPRDFNAFIIQPYANKCFLQLSSKSGADPGVGTDFKGINKKLFETFLDWLWAPNEF